MNNWIKVIGSAVIIAGSTIAVSVISRPIATASAAPQASGQDLYLDKCSICHGKDGSGNTAKGRKLKVKDAKSPEVQKLTEAQMIEIVAKGKGTDMDGFEKDLGMAGVKSVVTYYRSLGAAH